MRTIRAISSIHSRSAINSSASASVKPRGRKSSSSLITAKHRVHTVRAPGSAIAASPGFAVDTAFKQAPHPTQRPSVIHFTSGNMLFIGSVRSFPGSIPRSISPLCIFALTLTGSGAIILLSRRQSSLWTSSS